MTLLETTMGGDFEKFFKSDPRFEPEAVEEVIRENNWEAENDDRI